MLLPDRSLIWLHYPVEGMANAVEKATLAVTTAGLAHLLYTKYQEVLSKASRLNSEYGDKYRHMMSFFTEYKDAQAKGEATYADAFAKHAHPIDREAERHRGSLSGFWDNVRCSS